MATVTLTQAGTGNANMRLQVTYSSGGGAITITNIAGARTDGYETNAYGDQTWVYCNIGGTVYTLTPSYGGLQKIEFGANSNYTTFWSGSQSKTGMSGNQTVEFTFACNDGTTNIVNSKFTTTIDAGSAVTTPTLSGVSVSNVGRTSASASFSVTNNGGASIVDNYIDCGTYNFGNVVSTITGTSGSFSNLTPNTTYYVRANASNGTYRGYSAVGSFKTTGNAPSITSVSTSPTTNSCSFTINVSYDTNDGFASRTIEYGTSTSYGSSTTGTSITGLSQNTTYYYKITINSTQGRSATYTGSFKTLETIGIVRFKNNGTYKNANTYIKVNDTWKQASAYLKVNGSWKKGV